VWELKARLLEKGMSTQGPKAELVARLEEWRRAERAAAAPASPAPPSAPCSPLLDYTEAELILHFTTRTHKTAWTAFILEGTNKTGENAKAVAKKLVLKIHPDKCKLDGANEAFIQVNRYKDALAKILASASTSKPASTGYTPRAAPDPTHGFAPQAVAALTDTTAKPAAGAGHPPPHSPVTPTHPPIPPILPS